MFARITLILALLSGAAIADTPRVVTDIAPVHSLVSQVMQGAGTPELLLETGADPHSFQLRPSQARALARADMVIWIGPDLTPWLERAIAGLAHGVSLPLLLVPGTVLRAADGGHEGHDGHDPHAWLDPENARIWVIAIAEALAQHDPVNAGLYRANATATAARLELLSKQIAQTVALISDQRFLTDHNAFGYFADRFGLTMAGALRDSDAAPPNAAHMAEMRALVTGGDISCILAEDGMNKQLVLAVSEGTDVPNIIVDLLGRLSAPGIHQYADTLTRLAGDMAACSAAK